MSTLVGGVDVSRETIERLKVIEQLTLKWNKSINLVAKNTLRDLWNRHIVDSAQLYAYAPDGFSRWVDLGSGGGFPALIVAAMAVELDPVAEFTLVESDARKSQFLRNAVRECGLNARVLVNRIEKVPPLASDVITARALAPLSDLLSFCVMHGRDDVTAIFPKGRRYREEIEGARKNFRFDVVAHESLTDKEARILVVRNILREPS